METISSPKCWYKLYSLKRWFELELHGTKTQKASIIDTTVKAFQRTVFFDHKLYPSMERLSNSDSTVTQLWNPITIRNPEDGYDTFSETWVRTRATLKWRFLQEPHGENIVQYFSPHRIIGF
jgi:hypothetical protein